MCNTMSKRHDILPIRSSFFISSAGNIENVQEFKVKLLSTCFIEDSSHVKIESTSKVHSVAQIKQPSKFPNFRLSFLSKKTDLKFS